MPYIILLLQIKGLTLIIRGNYFCNVNVTCLTRTQRLIGLSEIRLGETYFYDVSS